MFIFWKCSDRLIVVSHDKNKAKSVRYKEGILSCRGLKIPLKAFYKKLKLPKVKQWAKVKNLTFLRSIDRFSKTKSRFLHLY